MSNFDESFFKDLLKEEREECLKGPGIDLDLHEAFVEACQSFTDAKEAKEAADADLQEIKKFGDSDAKKEAEDMLNVWSNVMKDALERCAEMAKPILETIDLMEYDLEMSLLRTAILTRATAKGFSKFANGSDLNGQLVETLLNNKKIMKEMLLQGGAKDNAYGNAMKQYTGIMAGMQKDRFHKVNKKLAMAAALECASPPTEFDTSVEIEAQKRFNHYEKAHRKGELDPAFTHFRTWEYRMAINSDAPSKQLQWGRDMLMAYSPHIATIYDERWRYNYQVKCDVGYRAPHWTSSPRTYQQLLSGGGREGPRAWYGRFICQAFGIPVWGVKQPGNVAMSRWTPKGWVLNFGLPGDWDISSHDNRLGADFFEECKARSAASEQEYYERVILLDCLADACKEKNKKIEEAGFVNPNKVWRSLALMQRKIFADTVKEESYQRTGPGVVVTKIEKYIQEIDDNAPPLPFEVERQGGVIIPAASFSESNGKKHVKANGSFGGGTQLHLIDGEGYATYEIPTNSHGVGGDRACSDLLGVLSALTPRASDSLSRPLMMLQSGQKRRGIMKTSSTRIENITTLPETGDNSPEVHCVTPRTSFTQTTEAIEDKLRSSLYQAALAVLNDTHSDCTSSESSTIVEPKAATANAPTCVSPATTSRLPLPPPNQPEATTQLWFPPKKKARSFFTHLSPPANRQSPKPPPARFGRSMFTPIFLTEGVPHDLRPYDILCGREKVSYHNIGNRRLRVLISAHIQRYWVSNRTERGMITRQILETIHNAGGRFFKQEANLNTETVSPNNGWAEISEAEARDKIGHCVRDQMSCVRGRNKRRQAILTAKQKAYRIAKRNATAKMNNLRRRVASKT